MWIFCLGILLCFCCQRSEQANSYGYGANSYIEATIAPPGSIKVVVHRVPATWSQALETCEKEPRTSLLCYSNSQQVSQHAAELTFLGHSKMWVRNRNCSLPVFEPNLSIDLRNMDLSRSVSTRVPQHKFNLESYSELLPYICFTNVSKPTDPSPLVYAPTKYATEDEEAAVRGLLEGNLEAEKIQENILRLEVINDGMPWKTAQDRCNDIGRLSCINYDDADNKKAIEALVRAGLNNPEGPIRFWFSGNMCNSTEISDGYYIAISHLGWTRNKNLEMMCPALCEKNQIQTTSVEPTSISTPSTVETTGTYDSTSSATPGTASSATSDSISGTASNFTSGTASATSTATSSATSDHTSSITTDTTSNTTSGSKCCPAVEVRGVKWEEQCSGDEVSKRPCPQGGRGEASWKCDTITGDRETPTPDLSSCTSANTTEHFSKINSTNVPEALESIKNWEKVNFGGDLVVIVDSLNRTLENLKLYINSVDPSLKEDTAENMTELVSHITDNLLATSNVWADLPEVLRVVQASSLLSQQQSSAFEYAYALNNTGHRNIARKSFEMEVFKITKGSYENENLTLPLNAESKDQTQFILPAGFEESLPPVDKDDYTFVVFFKYNNLSELLVVRNSELYPSAKTAVNSPVLSVSLNSHESPVHFGNKKAVFYIPHLEERANGSVCSFWNVLSYDWDSAGCELIYSNKTHTVCACDHLTNFAVLMDIHGAVDTLSDDDIQALKVITQIGCILSIVFLTAAIVVTTVYRALWGMRNSVHRNLCICLLVAEVVFVCGIDKTDVKVLCAVIAGLLHYFFLATFCWMLLEAVVIYLLLYKVFSPKKSYTRRFYAFGYGAPMLIVGISAAIRPSGYGTDTVCWLTRDHLLMLSFVGPAAFILTLNFIALVYALHVAIRTNRKINSKAGIPVSRTWILGALTLVPLLGITWTFGFLLLKNEPVIIYVFTILNSLQGAAIFIVQCLLNQSSRKCLMKSFGKYIRIIPVVSTSSTQRSTVHTDVRQQSTKSRRRRKSSNTTQPQPTVPAVVQTNGATVVTPPRDGWWRWTQSKSLDLSSANYTESSDICYSTSDSDSRGVVLRSAQAGDTTL